MSSKKNQVQTYHKVVHHNDLTDIPLAGFTATEKNIFMTQVYLAYNQNNNIVAIDPLELRKIIGYKSRDPKRFKEIMDSYSDKVMNLKAVNRYTSEDNEITHKTHVVHDMLYDEKGKLVTVFSENYLYLFNDPETFNTYILEEYCSIPSIHSKECYHALMRYKDTGFWAVDIDAFRIKCEIPPDIPAKKLKSYLDKMMKDISPFLEDLSYEFKKGGYRNTQIVGVKISFKPVKKLKLDKKREEKALPEKTEKEDINKHEYKCPYCGEPLKYEIVDNKEILIHDKPGKDGCNRKFTYPEYAIAIMNKTDEKNKKITCPICGDKLTEKEINGNICWCHPENFKIEGKCQKIWNAISDIREYEIRNNNYKEENVSAVNEIKERINEMLNN